MEDKDNGVRVYIGSKDVPLSPGEYTYTLRYHTDRQLGFFEKHDELYWNVTGNGWDFTIEKASATVELPPGAEVTSSEAYTGLMGEKGTDFTISRDDRGLTVFSTTKPLNPQEGLTIVVMWPKGFVREPTRAEKTKLLLLDNGSAVAGSAGIIILLVYYFFVWLGVGKDPEKGVIIPQFEAPKGFSPEAVRYVMHMGYDDKAFAAAVVNMAVKGYITIQEDAGGDYSFIKKGSNEAALSPGEKRIARQLFGTRTSIAIKTENHTAINQAIKDLKKSLAVEYEKIYFVTNSGTLIPGLVISVLALAVIVLLGRRQAIGRVHDHMALRLDGRMRHARVPGLQGMENGHNGPWNEDIQLRGGLLHLPVRPAVRWFRRLRPLGLLLGHIAPGGPVHFHHRTAQHPLLPPHEGADHQGAQDHGPDRGFETVPLCGGERPAQPVESAREDPGGL